MIINKNFFEKKVLKKQGYLPLNKNNLKCIKIFKRFPKLINFCSIFVFICIYYLYYLSLEKCFAGHARCSKKSAWIQKKLNEGLLCSFLLLFMCELMIQKIISKLHLMHLIVIFISFYIYSHGLEFYDHGLFNLFGVSAIIIIGNIFFVPLNINKYDCEIIIPKYCPYKFLQFFWDFSKKNGIKCGQPLNAKNRILKVSKSKYMNENTKIIGFPNINKNEIWSTKSYQNKTILNIFSENMIDMENKSVVDNLKKDNFPEIIVNFSDNDKGKMIINLNFDENLSKQRKELEKKYYPYSSNIIVLYFDSVSRANGLRKLKKTLNFFERFMAYNSKKFHSFQFFRYHALKHYTPGNYPKLFMNIYRKKKKNLRITYYLKKYGYVTAFSIDMCNIHPYPTKFLDVTKEELCDHEFLLCDPNKKHVSAMTKRCLYGKTDIDYQYEYGLQFWRLYRQNRKFLMIVNNDGHEGTLEVIKYDDDTIYNFLNTLYKENLLNDTTILLLSDHGSPMPSIYYFNGFFHREKQLPMLYIFTSDKDNQTYYEQYHNIYNNQQRFITAYDIYNTLCYLMLGKNYYHNSDIKIDYISKATKGINLFDQINKKRSPNNYKNIWKGVCK